MSYKKGDAVIKYLAGAGYVTEDPATVLKVDKKGVWLDNGPGNDPEGPFDPKTGNYADNGYLPGFRSYIGKEE